MPDLKNTYDFRHWPKDAAASIFRTQNNEKSRVLIQMNALNRPEYYVVPARHPGNCRCSKHGGKISLGAPSILRLETGGQSASAFAEQDRGTTQRSAMSD